MALKVMFVDDNKILCEGLCFLMQKETTLKVVASARNLEAALRLAAETTPDIIVISMNILASQGFEAARHLIGGCPRSRVIALAENTDRHHVVEAFKAGVRGYVLKESSFHELVEAIISVAGNNGFLDTKLNSAAIYGQTENKGLSPSGKALKLLSEREKEVLRLMAEGKNNHEIGAVLDIRAKTIESHRRNISRKLGMCNIAELTRYAIREGISSL